ncbi:hypothetical protein ABK040_008613 [Willaertia magna]
MISNSNTMNIFSSNDNNKENIHSSTIPSLLIPPSLQPFKIKPEAIPRLPLQDISTSNKFHLNDNILKRSHPVDDFKPSILQPPSLFSPERKKHKGQPNCPSNNREDRLLPSTSCSSQVIDSPPFCLQHPSSSRLECKENFQLLKNREVDQEQFYCLKPNSENEQENNILTELTITLSTLLQFLKSDNFKSYHQKACCRSDNDLCNCCFMVEHLYIMSCLYMKRICFCRRSTVVKNLMDESTDKASQTLTKIMRRALAVASLRIAAKVIGNDICFSLPSLIVLSKCLTRYGYPERKAIDYIIRMENYILKEFKFDHLMCVTPISLFSVLINGEVFNESDKEKREIEDQALKLLTDYSLLSSSTFIQLRPSMICCAILAYVRKRLNVEPWPNNLEEITSYSFNDLENTVHQLMQKMP